MQTYLTTEGKLISRELLWHRPTTKIIIWWSPLKNKYLILHLKISKTFFIKVLITFRLKVICLSKLKPISSQTTLASEFQRKDRWQLEKKEPRIRCDSLRRQAERFSFRKSRETEVVRMDRTPLSPKISSTTQSSTRANSSAERTIKK